VPLIRGRRFRSQGLLPFNQSGRGPYLYSDQEIRSLLRAALNMPCRFKRGKLRPWVYYCLFGLLSVSGLRLGEVRNLELQDVDLEAAVLTIRGRQVRQDSSGAFACIDLHGALRLHRQTSADTGQDEWCPPICSSPTGAIVWIRERFIETFYALSSADRPTRHIRQSGPSSARRGAIRFATNTLVQWYRSGQDPERRLPLLSTYLGQCTRL